MTDFPSDTTMLILLAILTGEAITVTPTHDLELTVSNLTPDGREEASTVPANRASLDELEAKGWVEVVEAGVVATDRGKYWVEKWVKNRCGVKGRARVVIGEKARVGGRRVA